MNTRMFNEELVATSDYQQESGNKWVLEYYLQIFEGESGESLYGLRVDKSTPEGVLHESEETFAITECREEALVMAMAFSRGSVPPVTLLEMSDDWLSELESNLLTTV
ncbi:MAG: DUF6514 family protein [Defluviitaleaceae bacterium]|nr:DUF6514 family protein [Defluviitaleaceae bacterium]MCL2264083.1 DUF6514 family protein [Defluviitaleaceae bacterium]